MDNVWTALGLTLFAGLSTGIGSAIAFTAKRTNYRFLSIATGFSAGAMLYVSFVELLRESVNSLTEAYGTVQGHWVNAAAFFGGILLIGIIDNLIPAADNPHETHSEEETAPLHNPLAPKPHFDAASVNEKGGSEHGMHRHGMNSRSLM